MSVLGEVAATAQNKCLRCGVMIGWVKIIGARLETANYVIWRPVPHECKPLPQRHGPRRHVSGRTK